eukprot:TRINITY_DN48138_c0_g1_i1.p1 TRINITY_DN48138_c0_g1~~TRINITY_DN48138_c0_g1_i1.p1  ORF type:complete len:224 (-),score=17.17 TRINITY_DN48138_c0_g1_i1:348-1019(-)
MRLFASALAAVAVVLLVQPSTAAYFLLQPGIARCFVENVPGEFPVTVSWKTGAFRPRGHPLPPTGVEIEITDPSNAVLAIFEVKEESGKVEVVSREGSAFGLHEICFHSNGSTWDARAPWAHEPVNIDVDIHVGSDAVNWDLIASRDHLSDIELAVRRTRDTVMRALKLQKNIYVHDGEVAQLASELNWRLIMWGAAQLIISFGTAYGTFRYLESLLLTRKMV